MRRANISVQTIFYIMMAILMIAIIVFGFQRLAEVEDVISESERLDITNKVTEIFEQCEDPLNQGNIEIEDMTHKEFNTVCIIGDDVGTYDPIEIDLVSSGLRDELASFLGSNNNVFLIESNMVTESAGIITIKDHNIIDSFFADVNDPKTQCYFEDLETQELIMELRC